MSRSSVSVTGQEISNGPKTHIKEYEWPAEWQMSWADTMCSAAFYTVVIGSFIILEIYTN